MALNAHWQLRLRKSVITYILMTGLGFVLAFGAQYGDRAVRRQEPLLVEINPTISKIFFSAKTLGLMIAAVGVTSTAVVAYS
jgi:hypothetical protein